MRPSPSPRGLRTVLLLALSAAGLLEATFAPAAEPKSKPKTVSMVVDYNDGVQVHFTALPYREEMTVLDAVTAAAAHKHGVPFTHRGSGALAMLTKFGEVKNEGGGEKSKNWMFYVNGKPATASMGVTRLEPGAAVLWKFETYDYNQQQSK